MGRRISSVFGGIGGRELLEVSVEIALFAMTVGLAYWMIMQAGGME